MKPYGNEGQQREQKQVQADAGVGSVSTNRPKMEAIRPWMNPEERISLDFEDTFNLNAEVVDCTEQVVTLRLEASGLEIPHHYQDVVIPLREVTVTEDPTRYTRNPDAPLRYGRLKLIVRNKRPAVV